MTKKKSPGAKATAWSTAVSVEIKTADSLPASYEFVAYVANRPTSLTQKKAPETPPGASLSFGQKPYFTATVFQPPFSTTEITTSSAPR
jgi:hypothetical protein